MEIGCLAIPHPSRVLRDHGSDVNHGRCPKRATQSSVVVLVHRRSIVLSDAKRLVGVGSWPPFIRCYAFHVLDTHDACTPHRALSAAWLVRRGPRGANVLKECYLVDPATNTCNKPQLLEGMHLLDKRSTRAMPVALMIHDNSMDRTAFVPTTHLTINNNTGLSESGNWNEYNLNPLTRIHWRASLVTAAAVIPAPIALNYPGRSSDIVTLKKLEARRRSDIVLVSTINDADQGSTDVTFKTPSTPYEKSKSLGFGGSMVARLKLQGIDGRAPPGVEPTA
ncbi:uncharacterized protein LOC111310708 [Durio zibethinus]|uniref:Uncharacterized protein LOC111310708 n=1 Tax=Durio zibethinus TaxID=66656 RepID=A0A6P6ALY8_DURZI|nr:uncharacterized protein LOC111310708 [Durio zibethinus]